MSPSGWAQRNRVILLTNTLTLIVLGVAFIVAAIAVPQLRGSILGYVGGVCVIVGIGVGIYSIVRKRKE